MHTFLGETSFLAHFSRDNSLITRKIKDANLVRFSLKYRKRFLCSCFSRGVHGLGWVGLRIFFGPTQKLGLVRVLIGVYMVRVGLHMSYLVIDMFVYYVMMHCYYEIYHIMEHHVNTLCH